MKKKWFILSAVLLISLISCGNNETASGESGKTENPENYGEETIGYKNSSEAGDSGDSGENGTGDAGDAGDTGNTGDTADTGDTSDTGDTGGHTPDDSTVTDEDEFSDDDSSEINSGSVKKEPSWTDWAGIYIAGQLNDFSAEPVPALITFIDGEISGSKIFDTDQISGGMVEKDDFFMTYATSLLKNDGDVSEYINFDSYMPVDMVKQMLYGVHQLNSCPVFVSTEMLQDDNDTALLRKECIVAVTKTDEYDQFIGNMNASSDDVEVQINDFFKLNINAALTTEKEKIIEAANTVREGLEAFTEPCICYDKSGSVMDCTKLDEELAGTSIQLLSEDPEIFENPFYTTSENPAVTFGLDVDTASYTYIRSQLAQGLLPNPESVRIEEMINYFKYFYKKPAPDEPFTLYSELGTCPWNIKRQLLMIGVRGTEVEVTDQPSANMVYLIDVSGSMHEELPLMKKAFRMLAKQMRPDDIISIVTYAGNESVVLDGANGTETEKILEAIDMLESGGSTNGEGGINKAYEIAEKHFISGGNNRVVLATDGDFNVGISDDEALVDLISEKKDSGIFLSVYGFGGANYQDVKMEQLADNGNGVYFYIDGAEEARRAFMNSLTGTMLTIAKDVKLQIQFNPDFVKGFRLIGYDNRVMSNDDFDDDTVDGGELGNSMEMTAFVEIIPADSSETVPPIGDGENINKDDTTEFADLGEKFVSVRIRYKDPDSDESMLIENNLSKSDIRQIPSLKYIFAAAVAELGLILRHSAYIEERSIEKIAENVKKALAIDPEGAVQEFLDMVIKAHDLDKNNP